MLARTALCAVAFVVIVEAAARLAFSIEPVFRRVAGRDDASSQRLKWVLRHTARAGAPAYSFDVYSPVTGWVLEPNIRNMAIFGSKTLNSNSKGIRGTAEYPYERIPGRRRIVAVGDSFTFGDEVSDNETYSYYLEHLLPDTEVLNMGMSGYGHDQMLLYLEHEGLKYRPDLVLIGFVWFDIYRNIVDFATYSKPRFELNGNGLRLTNSPVPPPQAVLDGEVYRSKAIDLSVIVMARLRGFFEVNRTPAEQITLAIFDRMVSEVRQANAVPVFVYLPVLGEVLNQDEAMTANERFLFTYCQGRHVPCLFLRDRFLLAEKKGERFNTRSHWLANSHRTAAERIAEYLRESSLITGSHPRQPFALRGRPSLSWTGS